MMLYGLTKYFCPFSKVNDAEFLSTAQSKNLTFCTTKKRYQIKENVSETR